MTAAAVTAVAAGVGATAAVGSVIQAKKQAKTAGKAADVQATELKKQEDIRAKQDKLTAERTARADTATTERKARLSSGRKGLLYAGDETGVTPPTDVLGG